MTDAQLGIERPRLFIDLHERRVYIGCTNIFPVAIPVSALCFYTVAAARRRRTADAVAAIRPDDLPLNALGLVRDYAGAKQYRQDGSEKGDAVAQMLARRAPELNGATMIAATTGFAIASLRWRGRMRRQFTAFSPDAQRLRLVRPETGRY